MWAKVVIVFVLSCFLTTRKFLDARSQELWLVRDPLQPMGLVALYLLIIVYGRKFMANRAAFELRPVLIVYNFGLVILSAYMMYEFFFVLRKKNNQITFLHLYHHSSILLMQWFNCKYVPGGMAYFAPAINCFIHIVMYFYYMMSAFGPQMQKYLWWKRYLTTMQLVQFVAVLAHCSYSMTMECDLPKGFIWVAWVYMVTLFTLFSNFYNQNYIVAWKKQKPE